MFWIAEMEKWSCRYTMLEQTWQWRKWKNTIGGSLLMLFALWVCVRYSPLWSWWNCMHLSPKRWLHPEKWHAYWANKCIWLLNQLMEIIRMSILCDNNGWENSQCWTKRKSVFCLPYSNDWCYQILRFTFNALKNINVLEMS